MEVMGRPAFDISKLSPQQRLELIGELWDSPEDELPPLDPELLAELDRRLAEFEADPSEGRPAAEVIARIRTTLR
jgi:putative addiction module component (TIGR02574 family)